MIDDRGDHIVVRPASSDPVAAFRGSLANVAPSSDEARAIARAEEQRIDPGEPRGSPVVPSRPE